ncbi:hypothetical protein DPMN_015300 [Dreissena polymorpha]|uniref:Uncharacterized protein n=1 Tax=Dreissena polymorpha TaxID=45954 RepID=A0A9D4S5C7_DREPO|nr:hypothetical protein DPMN_015300 [Dreissena polymorpha]
MSVVQCNPSMVTENPNGLILSELSTMKKLDTQVRDWRPMSKLGTGYFQYSHSISNHNLSKVSLKFQIHIHMMTTEERYICAICARGYKHRRNLTTITKIQVQCTR